MRKAREVDAMDYGALRPDGKYANKSFQATSYLTTPRTKAHFLEVSEGHLMGNHRLYLSTAAINPPAVSFLPQTEVFESTERHRPEFNSCRHTKSKCVTLPFGANYWLSSTDTWSGASFLCGWRAYRSVYPTVVMPEIDWKVVSSNMQAEAYWGMVPKFEGDISMINFLMELKDFRDVSRMFAQIGRTLGDKLHPFSSPTKRTAEYFLGVQFALRPFLRDLKAILSQAQTLVYKAQMDFASQGLTDTDRHYSIPLSSMQSVVRTNFFGSSQYVSLFDGSKSSGVWTATMEGNYGYTMRSDLNAFGKYWGLDITAEALWNALPFSFLVDYVFTVSKALRVMRRDNNVHYHIVRYCESILQTYEKGYFIGPGLTPDKFPITFAVDNTYLGRSLGEIHFVTGRSCTAYERVVKTPYWGPHLPRFRVPSGIQSLNAAALLVCLL